MAGMFAMGVGDQESHVDLSMGWTEGVHECH